MPINHDVVGATGDPAQLSWTSKDGLIYALGVGAGTDELAFTTENSIDLPQRLLPTHGVVLGMVGSNVVAAIGEFNFAMLVHGEQAITLHREIPVEGTLTARGRIAGIYDKGSGAAVVIESDCVDAATGEPFFSTSTTMFIRGEGGWGGDRGPSGTRNTPPERSPDHSLSYRTRPDQALIYRLSGDRNPLHSDPKFAAIAGFDRPILHGLCTYGLTCRAVLQAITGFDPDQIYSHQARFSAPVFPGDTITVDLWKDGKNISFEARVKARGVTVIKNGLTVLR
jgi:acyl dehydratase